MTRTRVVAIMSTATMLFLSGLSPAGAVTHQSPDRGVAVDGVLDSAFWSRTTPPTSEQAANRKALSIEVKEAARKGCSEEGPES
ncbi:hypothetical protein AB0323_08875 [Arthrobacter sp. NPDC080031]|uniref:hypothetical protein n=1 Tax=Arthrobacter sp. NPDC080031 TaxID=3155918 RepID=UPI00344BD690